MLINRLRLLIRNSLRQLIRNTMIKLCVGVPVIAFVQLMEELKKSIQEMMKQLLPQVVYGVLATLAFQAMQALMSVLKSIVMDIIEVLGAITDFLYEAFMVWLRVVATLFLVVTLIGSFIAAIVALFLILSPLPGDELLMGSLSAALLLIVAPLLWSFITNDQGSSPELA